MLLKIGFVVENFVMVKSYVVIDEATFAYC